MWNLQTVLQAVKDRRSVATCELDPILLDELRQYGLDVSDSVVSQLREPTFLDVQKIRSDLDESVNRYFGDIQIRLVSESTNKELAESSVSKQARILLAELQTQGRGRRGRSWISPFASNIMCSIADQLDVSIAAVGAFSLVMGIVIAQAIESVIGEQVQLKWPNDVYLRGKKVGGILIEMIQTEPLPTLVIGFGINVDAAPKNLANAAVSAIAICDIGGSIERNHLCSTILNGYVRAKSVFEAQGLSVFIDEWIQRDVLAGQQVQVQGLNHAVIGTNLGINSSGALLVESDSGIEVVVGGDVSLRTI